jgi:sugar lactone lactonase YvrE
MSKYLVVLVIAIVVLAAGVPGVAARSQSFPDIIPLPDGFRPEGVVVGRGYDIYAGSLAAGAIYRADLRTGLGEIVVPDQVDRIAVGLAFDSRSNFLFAAGGPAGAAYVYDAQTGETVGLYQFTGENSFVNDVVVTNGAAYFTDSFRPFFYRVPLGANGQLADPSAVEEIPLGGDFVFVPGSFNSNGIDATPDGKSLVIVNSTRGELFHVDPKTGDAGLIDLGGAGVPSGDGILLDGKTLYVMQNRLNQIAVVRVDAGLSAGEIVSYITDPAFDVPTTIAEFGHSLYAVNARFGTTPTPDTEYDIVMVTKQK